MAANMCKSQKREVKWPRNIMILQYSVLELIIDYG